MDTNEIPTGTSQQTATVKKPYVKPSYRYEQVFVTTALTCSKAPTEGQCLRVVPQSAS